MTLALEFWEWYFDFGNDTIFDACFPVGPSSLPVAVAQPDKELANKAHKNVQLCIDVARE